MTSGTIGAVGRLSLLLAVTAAACSGGTTGPTPPPPPNAAPVIASIIASRDRAEVTDEITFAATVTDAETPLAQLTYQWSAASGTITSTNGAVATWRPPTTVDKATPFTVTLTVVERYVSGIPRENRVSATSPVVQVLDSMRENGDLAIEFLKKFANDAFTPQQCVSTFSDRCIGKEWELGDIQTVRARFTQIEHKLGTPVVTVNADRTQATVLVPCEFYSRDKETGVAGWAIGTCRMTSVLENLKWWLCTSFFDSISTFDKRFIF
jgi:hypothetical protein